MSKLQPVNFHHRNHILAHVSLFSAIHAAQHHSEGKAMVIVRVPKQDEISLTTALDAGAAGIVIPHCESAKEVKQVLEEAYYREYLSLRVSRETLVDVNDSPNWKAIF